MLVRVLEVPSACQPGDAVYQEGGAVAETYPKECKSKVGWVGGLGAWRDCWCRGAGWFWAGG